MAGCVVVCCYGPQLVVERAPTQCQSLTHHAEVAAFVSEATNILLGPPGVGKTHLAVALALRSIENGYGAYFVRAYDLMEDLRKARAEHHLMEDLRKARAEHHLMEDLRKARAEHRLDRRMRVYLAPKGAHRRWVRIWPYDRDSATAFFSLVSSGAAASSHPTRASESGESSSATP